MTEATKERNGRFVRDSIWIARDGSERRVICIDDADVDETTPEKRYPIVSSGKGGILRHTILGECGAGMEYPEDLIREKREPREFFVRAAPSQPFGYHTAWDCKDAPILEGKWIKVREVLE